MRPRSNEADATLLAECLAGAGVARVFGAPLRGWPVLSVRDRLVARRLAEADGRIGGVGAANFGDAELILTGGPAPARVMEVDDPAQLPDAVAEAALDALAPVPAATRLRLRFDPELPARAGLHGRPVAAPPRWIEPGRELVKAIDAAELPVVVAGPGVVRAGCLPGLHALATRLSIGVLNTWGAKGAFDWRSRHHLATAGLQARDFELAGLEDVDLIVSTGVDPNEAVAELPDTALVAVNPGELAPLAEAVRPVDGELERPALYEVLAAVTQRGWKGEALPPAPSRLTRTYAESLGGGGLVAADPGIAGFFVARTFPTTVPGSVLVPGAPDADGFAVCAAGASLLREPRRAALAVVDSPLDQVSEAALDALAALGLAVAVETWTPDGEAMSAAGHEARLRAALTADSPQVHAVGYESGQLREFVEAAGEIVAWQGEEHR